MERATRSRVAVLDGRERSGFEPLDHGIGVLAFAGHRRHDPFAVLARRKRRADLAQQRHLVGHEPGLGDLAVSQAEDADLVDVDGLAGRRNAEQVAFVGAGDLEQEPDHVALGDDLHRLIDPVREGAAQIVAGAGEALALSIGGEMKHAAAVAPVVGRHEFRLDLLHRLAELLRLLEAKHRGLVALALRRLLRTLRGGEARTVGQHQAGSGCASEHSTAGQHAILPRVFFFDVERV